MESGCRSLKSLDSLEIIASVGVMFRQFHLTRLWSTDSAWSRCCAGSVLVMIENGMAWNLILVWKATAGDLVRPGLWGELEDESSKEWSCADD